MVHMCPFYYPKDEKCLKKKGNCCFFILKSLFSKIIKMYNGMHQIVLMN